MCAPSALAASAIAYDCDIMSPCRHSHSATSAADKLRSDTHRWQIANSTRSNSRKLPISQLIGSIIIASAHARHDDAFAQFIKRDTPHTLTRRRCVRSQVRECFGNRLTRPATGACARSCCVQVYDVVCCASHTRYGSIIHSICHVVYLRRASSSACLRAININRCDWQLWLLY